MQSSYHSFPLSGSSPILSPTNKPPQSPQFAPLRPWRHLIAAASSPDLSNLRRNLYYFRANYAAVLLLVIFLGLLWHPISIIMFLIVLVAWILLYFGRDEPVEVFNRRFDDRAVLSALSVVTVVSLGFTGVSLNVFLSVVIGAAVVALHAAVRDTGDLYLDEDEVAGFGGGGATRVVII